MIKKLLLFSFLMGAAIPLSAQNNPVENLNWSHWYEFPRNFFELSWAEPAQPHGEPIGYNIYRNDELYRFQTETTVYNYFVDVYGIVTNCNGESFLEYDNQNQFYDGGIDIYVTAVYAGQNESEHLQTFHDKGLLLSTKNFTAKKAALFPNPTNGILNIAIENLKQIGVYDISGKEVKLFAPKPQIDLSDFSKGLYLIKLFTDKEVIVDKIVIH